MNDFFDTQTRDCDVDNRWVVGYAVADAVDVVEKKQRVKGDDLI